MKRERYRERTNLKSNYNSNKTLYIIIAVIVILVLAFLVYNYFFDDRDVRLDPEIPPCSLDSKGETINPYYQCKCKTIAFDSSLRCQIINLCTTETVASCGKNQGCVEWGGGYEFPKDPNYPTLPGGTGYPNAGCYDPKNTCNNDEDCKKLNEPDGSTDYRCIVVPNTDIGVCVDLAPLG